MGQPRAVMRLVASIAIAFGYVWLLAGRIDAEALWTAGVLAVVTAAWLALLRHAAERRMAGGVHHLVVWLRAVAIVPRDTLAVGTALIAAIIGRPSRWRAIDEPFRFGDSEDPHDAGRRATVVAAGSLSPDRIVVDIAPGTSQAATHRLGGGHPGDPDWLA